MFTVLISVYHKEFPVFFYESLKSIFAQTLPPNEVVLVKDGSLTSELDAVCDEFSNQYPHVIKIVSLPKNVGLGKALNEGLKHCSHELVARMDSDDICKPARFEKQIMAFEQHEDVSVVGSWIDEFEDIGIKSDLNIISTRRLPEFDTDIKVYASTRCPLNHPSVMFKKSAIKAVGGYQHFYLFEDYYLWMRLLKSGYKFYNIQESLLYFRTNPQVILRRGGIKYAISEVQFFTKLWKMKIISTFVFLKNLCIRFPIRILPNRMRSYIYYKLLR